MNKIVNSVRSIRLLPLLGLLLLSPFAVAQTNAQALGAGAHAHLVGATKHDSSVNSISFSPDGSTLIAGYSEGLCRELEAHTGLELHSLIGHSNSVNSVLISPDGKLAVSGGTDKTIIIWDINTGKLRKQFTINAEVMSMAFSSDSKALYLGNDDAKISIVDVLTGQVTMQYVVSSEHVTDLKKWRPGSHENLWLEISAVALDKGNRYWAIGGWDSTVALIDIKRGIEVRRFGSADSARESTEALAFSPDGRYLLAGRESGAVLWDVQTGAVTWKSQDEKSVKAVAFSIDGRYMATGANRDEIKLWDVKTKALLWSVVLTAKATALAISPNGESIAVGAADGSTMLLKTSTGADIWPKQLEALSITSASIDTEGDSLLLSGGNQAMKWDLSDELSVTRFVGHRDTVLDASTSLDGNKIITASADFTSAIWNSHSGNIDVVLKGHKGQVNAAAIAPDGNTAVTASDDGTLKWWKVKNGELIQSVSWPNDDFKIVRVNFSPNGKFVLAISNWLNRKYQLKVFKVENTLQTVFATEIRGLRQNPGAIFSPDSQKLLSWGVSMRIWDTTTWNESSPLTAIPIVFATHDDVYPTSAAFAKDGKAIFSAYTDGTVRLWDVTGRHLQASGKVSDLQITKLGLLSGDKLMLIMTADGTVHIIRVDSFTSMGDIIFYENGDWVVMDREGRFDTNAIETISALHWVVDDDPLASVGVESLMRQYYTPKLLSRIGHDLPLRPVPSVLMLNRRTPSATIQELSIHADHSNLVDVTVKLEAGTTGRQMASTDGDPYDLRLLRNGVMIGEYPANTSSGSKLSDAHWRVKNRIEITQGKSRMYTFHDIQIPQHLEGDSIEFSAYVFNSDRVKSKTNRRTYHLEHRDTKLGQKAFLINFAVNANQSRNLSLQSAVNSAAKFSQIIEKNLPSYYTPIKVDLFSDFDEAGTAVIGKGATKENITTVFRLLAGETVQNAEREKVDPTHVLTRAAPDDIVILYVAAHGFTDAAGEFYLIPFDSGDNWGVTETLMRECDEADNRPRYCSQAMDLRKHSIVSGDLAAWWSRIDGGSQLLIIDSCHSGAVKGPDFRAAPLGDPSFGQLSYDKKMFIMSASQADQTELGMSNDTGGVTLLIDSLQRVAERSPGVGIAALLRKTAEQVTSAADKRFDGRMQKPEILSFTASQR